MRTSEYRGVLSHSFTLHSGAPCPAGLSATFVVSTASLSASTRSRVTRTQACARASHLQTRAVWHGTPGPWPSGRLLRASPGSCVSRCSARCWVSVSYTHLRAHETVLDLVC